MEKIKTLAEKVGISSSYLDKTGQIHYTSDKIYRYFLKSMGYETESADCVEREIAALETPRVFPEVISFYDNEKIILQPQMTETFQLTVTNEQGQVVRTETVADGAAVELTDIPTGYYDIAVEGAGFYCHSLLIYAPCFCYQPPFLQKQEHIFGVSVMLYSLHSANSIGIGDFGDLTEIVRLTVQNGGDVVGVNPLGAMSPFTMKNSETADVSPYRTLSRLFINYIYLNLRAEEDFTASEAVQAFMRQEETIACINKLNVSEKVLYKEVLRLKLKIAELMFAHFEKYASAERRNAFEAYKKEKGAPLHHLCVFEAVLEKQQVPYDFWRHWQGCEIDSPFVEKFIAEHGHRIDLFAYCHWLADNQLREVQKTALSLNMKIGLYTDMPIGAASNGCEVWENPSAYVLDCIIGAPADPMRPRGQSWGFTPYHPQVLKQQHYAPFIRLIRENMQISGALRIDHAMGLRRLYWGFFEKNNPVVQGAYVYYDMKDLTAILALESNRRKCLLIGEDLGTVPEGFREYMAEHGLLSYKVFCRQKEKNGAFIAPENYQYLSLAQISTHDQATSCGFWANEDIEVFKDCGLYVNEQQYQDNLSGRRKDCENIVRSLRRQNILSEAEAAEIEANELNNGQVPARIYWDMNKYGAQTNSALFLLRLCDVFQQKILDNAPGTIAEYPNWRYKLAHSLEEIKADGAFAKMMSMIAENRPA